MTTTTDRPTEKVCPSWCTEVHAPADWQNVDDLDHYGVFHVDGEVSSTLTVPGTTNGWEREDAVVEMDLELFHTEDSYSLPAIWLRGPASIHLSAEEAEAMAGALLTLAARLREVEPITAPAVWPPNA